MAQLESLMQQNFLEYSSYFVLDRAIPDLRDGLKPVQRRILHTLFSMSDGRFHKVANVIGETMKLHPHGDASIGDALVVLANKDYFIERQGNTAPNAASIQTYSLKEACLEEGERVAVCGRFTFEPDPEPLAREALYRSTASARRAGASSSPGSASLICANNRARRNRASLRNSGAG